MTRKRQPFTRKKKIRTSGGDPLAPSHLEWTLKMKEYGSFAVQDDDGEDHYFSKGNIALINPPQGGPTDPTDDREYWVAKIKEIRAREDGDVWVKVQWYYSGRDVADLIKSFKPSTFGEFERIQSDHYDLISSLCFDGLATVDKYNEFSIDQEPIDPDTFYSRFDLEHKIRKLSRHNDDESMTTCLCKQYYSPDSDKVMHFCPRPSCRKAYHRDCLLERHLTETTTADRDVRLLCSSPESDASFILSSSQPPAKRRRGAKTPMPSELLASLPPILVDTAKQPIVRGGVNGGGVAGNVKAVVAARMLVYDASQGLGVPDNWEEIVGPGMTVVPGRMAAQSRMKALDGPSLVCPGCRGPI